MMRCKTSNSTDLLGSGACARVLYGICMHELYVSALSWQSEGIMWGWLVHEICYV